MSEFELEFDCMHFILSVFPFFGFAAFLTGFIDLGYPHAEEVGSKKIKWFLISHTIYLLLIVLLS